MTWETLLNEEYKKQYMKDLWNFLYREESKDKVILPDFASVYRAFNLTPYDNVRVVIIGQDPYPSEGNAMGVAFGVPDYTPRPPSLKNILKEVEDNLRSEGKEVVIVGNTLEGWAKQGVLLLNTILTVESGAPLSHKGKGWEDFTDEVIRKLNEKDEHVIWLAWGNEAKKKVAKVNNPKHKVLTAPHPSPLSAHKGFFGCKHFSLVNEYFKMADEPEIRWEEV